MSYKQSNCDIDDWSEGIPDYGEPAANPARLGRSPSDFEARQAAFAKQLAAFVAGHPELLDEDICLPKKRRGRVKGTKVKT